jgi:hypothetical protein
MSAWAVGIDHGELLDEVRLVPGDRHDENALRLSYSPPSWTWDGTKPRGDHQDHAIQCPRDR